MEKSFDRASIIVDINRALLGTITPEVRQVSVAWDTLSYLIVYVFVDGDCVERVEDEMGVMAAQFMASYEDAEFSDVEVVRCDAPSSIKFFKAHKHNLTVYKRKEV